LGAEYKAWPVTNPRASPGPRSDITPRAGGGIHRVHPLQGTRPTAEENFLTPIEFDREKFPPYKDPPIRDFGGSNGQEPVPYRGG